MYLLGHMAASWNSPSHYTRWMELRITDTRRVCNAGTATMSLGETLVRLSKLAA
ncbi:hypothetical protein BX600DRAFT_460847 [Xylariales sp. PMI_506]|nr:hypothetical protein BX600DRAFT_460847 [Xylariales sp. PMI_506]